MSGRTLEEIRAVFLKARELPADQRPAYLDLACGNDAEFRQEVERSLRGDGVETLAADLDTPQTPPVIPDLLSAWRPAAIQIAGYQVLREISRGGQAVVCEAIQSSTKRKVAVKIMREGPLASPRSRRA